MTLWPDIDICLLAKEGPSRDEILSLCERLPRLATNGDGVRRVVMSHRVSGSVERNLLGAFRACPELEQIAEVRSFAEVVSERPAAGGTVAQVLDEKLAQYQDRILASLREALSVGVLSTPDHLWIKGAAILAVAPAYSHRYLNDLDIACMHVTNPLELAALVATYLPICEIHSGRQGCDMLHVNVEPAQPHLLTIDILINGPFMAYGYNEEHRESLWNRRKQGSIRDISITIPSEEDSVILLVAHSIEHSRFRLRDINDLHVLLNSRSEDFDWPYVFSWVKRMYATAALDTLLTQFAAMYGEDRIGAALKHSRAGKGTTLDALAKYGAHRSTEQRALGTIMGAVHTLGTETGWRKYSFAVSVIWKALRDRISRRVPGFDRACRLMAWRYSVWKRDESRLSDLRPVRDPHMVSLARALRIEIQANGFAKRVPGYFHKGQWHFYHDPRIGILALAPTCLLSSVSPEDRDDTFFDRLERVLTRLGSFVRR